MGVGGLLFLVLKSVVVMGGGEVYVEMWRVGDYYVVSLPLPLLQYPYCHCHYTAAPVEYS